MCVDGLKGFPQAIEAVFPQAQVQLCIVHLVRASLNYVTWKERKQVAADLKPIYRAATAEEAERNLASFMSVGEVPAIGKLWGELGASDSVLRVSGRSAQGDLHDQCGGVFAHESAEDHQDRGSFPSEEAALKLLYLALSKVIAKWETVQHWKQMLNDLETVLWRANARSRRPAVDQRALSPPAGDRSPAGAARRNHGPGARTVLGRKGSLRRAKARALAPCAPFCK